MLRFNPSAFSFHEWLRNLTAPYLSQSFRLCFFYPTSVLFKHCETCNVFDEGTLIFYTVHPLQSTACWPKVRICSLLLRCLPLMVSPPPRPLHCFLESWKEGACPRLPRIRRMTALCCNLCPPCSLWARPAQAGDKRDHWPMSLSLWMPSSQVSSIEMTLCFKHVWFRSISVQIQWDYAGGPSKQLADVLYRTFNLMYLQYNHKEV